MGPVRDSPFNQFSIQTDRYRCVTMVVDVGSRITGQRRRDPFPGRPSVPRLQERFAQRPDPVARPGIRIASLVSVQPHRSQTGVVRAEDVVAHTDGCRRFPSRPHAVVRSIWSRPITVRTTDGVVDIEQDGFDWLGHARSFAPAGINPPDLGLSLHTHTARYCPSSTVTRPNTAAHPSSRSVRSRHSASQSSCRSRSHWGISSSTISNASSAVA